MNGPHKVLEAALEYGNVPEDVRRGFRAEMGIEAVNLSLEIMDLCEPFVVSRDCSDSGDWKPDLPEGWKLDRDPDLWFVRDERGDVVFGVSAQTAMQESIESMAERYVEARTEIESERTTEEAAHG